ncbi:hypothetical protein [Cereibacter sphaeroides]|uniref:hypothetical protein n=1 Tax=Cereibacter sphaeroides TaxID=1063 RepID=UPI000F53BE6C|nr:hypothetical protein [Cereibacter sphaeroides]AZB70278.1 hypothetical protein EBL86_17930 [Cereibacter sphaeroides]
MHVFLPTFLAFFGAIGFAFSEYWPYGGAVQRGLEIGAGAGLIVVTSDGVLVGRILKVETPDSVTLERYDATGMPEDTVTVARHDLQVTRPQKGTPWVIFSGSSQDLGVFAAETGAARSTQSTSTVTDHSSGLVFTNSIEPIKPSPEPALTDTAVAVQDVREDQLRDQLRPASLAHNLPKRMAYGQTVRVELALTPDRSGLEAIAQLQNPIGATIVSGVQHSLRMEAVLSGEGFRIEHSGDPARLILPYRGEVWTWHVTPQTSGTRMLDLEVFAVLEADGTSLPPTRIRSFATTVNVDIGSIDKIKLFLNDVPLMQQVLITVLGSVLSSMGSVMMWLRLFPSKAVVADHGRKKIVRRR